MFIIVADSIRGRNGYVVKLYRHGVSSALASMVRVGVVCHNIVCSPDSTFGINVNKLSHFSFLSNSVLVCSPLCSQSPSPPPCLSQRMFLLWEVGAE